MNDKDVANVGRRKKSLTIHCPSALTEKDLSSLVLEACPPHTGGIRNVFFQRDDGTVVDFPVKEWKITDRGQGVKALFPSGGVSSGPTFGHHERVIPEKILPWPSLEVLWKKHLEGPNQPMGHVPGLTEALNRASPIAPAETEFQKIMNRKIDMAERALRLVKTLEQAADVVSRFCGKTNDAFRKDAKKAHESLCDVLIEQIKFFKQMKDNDFAGRNVAPTEQEMTFQDQLTMFLHSCLWEIDDLKKRNGELKSVIVKQSNDFHRSAKDHMDDTRKLRDMVADAEKRVHTFRELNEQRVKEIEHLKRSNAGLKSRITRLGSKRKPRKR